MASGWKHRRPAVAADRRRQYNSAEHRQLRARWQLIVDAGNAYCWRCHRWLPPGCSWHLGHNDDDRSKYEGAECVSCNLRAAARKGNAAQKRTQQRRRHQPTSRDW